jgi:hypothetical protein
MMYGTEVAVYSEINAEVTVYHEINTKHTKTV